jgi:trans-2,3-dihydro-3-hydroxyanthranilate isomerase
MSYRYRVVDVFTTQALEGNPLAVFPDASEIDELRTQKISREMNLSETVFVLPSVRSDCCARVRIFTPYQEMTFAGHPIIGATFVLLDQKIASDRSDHFALDVKVGPVPIRVELGKRPVIWLTTPPIVSGATYDRIHCAEVLGLRLDDLLDIPPQLLSAGNPTIFIGVKEKGAVDRAWLDLAGLRTLKAGKGEANCVFVFAPTVEAYSRMFAPEHGVPEDPATGRWPHT